MFQRKQDERDATTKLCHFKGCRVWLQRNIHMQMAHFHKRPPANLLLHTFHKHAHTHTYTYAHSHTLDTLMKLVVAALWRLLFQLINMFVSINRNYANYR